MNRSKIPKATQLNIFANWSKIAMVGNKKARLTHGRSKSGLSGVDREIEAWALQEIAGSKSGGKELDQSAKFFRFVFNRKSFADDFNLQSKKKDWSGAHYDPDSFNEATATCSIRRAIELLCRCVPHASHVLDLIDNVSAEIQAWALGAIAAMNGISAAQVVQSAAFPRFVADAKSFGDDFNAESGQRSWRGAHVDSTAFAASSSGGSIAHAIALLCSSVPNLDDA